VSAQALDKTRETAPPEGVAQTSSADSHALPIETAIDVVIPTLNEAGHIAEAVANARKVGRVFVLDSLSTDGTQELARRAGATVIEHAFEGYARQKNWGLTNLPMTGKWVFILDADERITPDLRAELFRTAADPKAAEGYFINRIMLFMGRPVRHGGLYPSWNLRFFQRGKCHYEDRSVHEHMLCEGRTEYLRHPMLHIRRETMNQYIAKHIRYADLESDEWVKRKLGMAAGAAPSRLFRDLLRVRQWLRREVWPVLPGRPFWRFFYMYFVRFGFLDGGVGWHLAMLMASYEYMISLLYHDKLARHRMGTFDPAKLNERKTAAAPKMN
jgi:glycosyltransferase involved in cell wall biosynthesis